MDQRSENSVAAPHSAEIKKESPLEGLPAELQNRIYALAVANGRDIDISSPKRQPPLAATNANIRKQVLPIFYGGNTFIVDGDRGKMPEFETAEIIVNQYSEYWKFIKSVGVNGKNPNIRSRGFLKIYARMKEGNLLEVQFSGIAPSKSPCMCSLSNMTGLGQDEHDQETLAKHLLLASVADLKKTIEQTVKSMLFNNLGMSYLADSNGANCYACSNYLFNYVKFN